MSKKLPAVFVNVPICAVPIAISIFATVPDFELPRVITLPTTISAVVSIERSCLVESNAVTVPLIGLSSAEIIPLLSSNSTWPSPVSNSTPEVIVTISLTAKIPVTSFIIAWRIEFNFGAV